MDAETCPECSAPISVGNEPQLGDLLRCMNCDTELIVARTSHLKLDWAFRPPLTQGEPDEVEPTSHS